MASNVAYPDTAADENRPISNGSDDKNLDSWDDNNLWDLNVTRSPSFTGKPAKQKSINQTSFIDRLNCVHKSNNGLGTSFNPLAEVGIGPDFNQSKKAPEPLSVQLLCIALAFFCGVCSTTYGSINIACRKAFDSPYWGSFIAYIGAVTCCLCLFATSEACSWSNIKHTVKTLASRPQTYICFFPCLLGVCSTYTMMISGSYSGLGFTFLAIVLGQVLVSLVFDRMGLVWTTKRSMPLYIMAPVFVLVGGALMFQWEAFSATDENATTGGLIGFFCLSMLAGAANVFQGAITKKASLHLGSSIGVSAYSYGTGIFIMAFLVAVLGYDAKIQPGTVTSYKDMWKFLGGIPGFISLYLVTKLPRHIPVSAIYVNMIAGQLSTALVYDHFGCLAGSVIDASLLRIFGVIVVIVGVALIQLVLVLSDRKERRVTYVANSELSKSHIGGLASVEIIQLDSDNDVSEENDLPAKDELAK